MISAKDNELIKQVSALMSSAKRRRESGSFAAEGVRLCADGVQSGAEALCFLYTDAARKKCCTYRYARLRKKYSGRCACKDTRLPLP